VLLLTYYSHMEQKGQRIINHCNHPPSAFYLQRPQILPSRFFGGQKLSSAGPVSQCERPRRAFSDSEKWNCKKKLDRAHVYYLLNPQHCNQQLKKCYIYIYIYVFTLTKKVMNDHPLILHIPPQHLRAQVSMTLKQFL